MLSVSVTKRKKDINAPIAAGDIEPTGKRICVAEPKKKRGRPRKHPIAQQPQHQKDAP